MAKADTQATRLNILVSKDEEHKYVKPAERLEINVSTLKLAKHIDANRPEGVEPLSRADTNGSTPAPEPKKKPITIGQQVEGANNIQELEGLEKFTLTPEEAKAIAEKKDAIHKQFDQGDAVEVDDEKQPLDRHAKSKDRIFEEGDIIKYMFENWFVKPMDSFVNEWILEPIIWAGTKCWDEWDSWRKEKQNMLSSDNTNSHEAKFAMKLGDYMQEQKSMLMKRSGAGPKEMKYGIKEITAAVGVIKNAQSQEEAQKTIENTLKKFSNITDPKAQEILLATMLDPNVDENSIKAAVMQSHSMQRFADIETKLKNGEEIPDEWLSPQAAKSLKAVYGKLTDEQKADPDLVRRGISKTIDMDVTTFKTIIDATHSKVVALHERGAYDNLDLDKMPIHKLVAIESEEISDALYKWIEKKPSVVDNPKGLLKAAQLATEGRDKLMKDIKEGNKTTGYDPNAPFFDKINFKQSKDYLDAQAYVYRESFVYDMNNEGVKTPVEIGKGHDNKIAKNLLLKWQRYSSPENAPLNPIFNPEKKRTK